MSFWWNVAAGFPGDSLSVRNLIYIHLKQINQKSLIGEQMQTQYQLILHNQTPLSFYLLCLIRSFIPCALFNIHCNTLSIPLINNAFRWSGTIYCLITSTQATLIQMPANIYSITPLPCSHAPLSLTNLHLFCLLVITTKAGGPLWSECLPTTTIKSVNPESTCPFTHQR